MWLGVDMKDLIKQVGGIEKAKEIVSGAPEWAQGFCFELSIYAASSKGSKLNITCLDDLRQAIADYNTDIQNHISPSTKVYDK